MQKRQLGSWVIAALAALNVVLWLIFPPKDDGRRLFYNEMVAEMFSSTGMILMACGIALSLRPRFLEPYFGGLDQMYKAHKTAALTGLSLVVLHFFTMPGSGNLSLGRDLGKLALIGLLTLVALTLAPRVPVVGGYIQLAYHQWRWTHKFVGAFFVVGLLHSLNVNNVLQFTKVADYYWMVFAYGGAGLYLYKELLAPFLRRPRAYSVEAVRKLNGTTLEVALKPHGPRAEQRAGQFVFVSFAQEALSEPHPFTVSSAPHEPLLRLSIKASGDWTKQLLATLKPGAAARVEGAYGMFDYQAGGPQQIWVAGGIGVTPFLSWVRGFTAQPPVHDIEFYYTARAEADALFWDEFAAAAQEHPRFRAVLNVSSRDGSLTADKIAAQTEGGLAGKHVYMCGPLAMSNALKAQFMAKGVPAQNIHYEEFNFR